jgi:hypothetical protein
MVTVLVIPSRVAPCGLGILSLSASWGGSNGHHTKKFKLIKKFKLKLKKLKIKKTNL